MAESKISCQCLSGSTLKKIALVTMLIDHTGFLLLKYGMLKTLAPETSQYGMWMLLYTAMRSVGRIAFPVYVFLMTEGIVHTRNWKRYGVRLGVFALLSDIPFDMMATGRLMAWTDQNVFFTLLIGLLTVKSAEYFCTKINGLTETNIHFLWLTATAAGCAAAELLKTDYGYIGIVLTTLFYLLRNDRAKQCILGFFWMFCNLGRLSYLWGLTAAFLLIYAYNGRRGGKDTQIGKYFFYIAYPAHILLLLFIHQIFFPGIQPQN